MEKYRSILYINMHLNKRDAEEEKDPCMFANTNSLCSCLKASISGVEEHLGFISSF